MYFDVVSIFFNFDIVCIVFSFQQLSSELMNWVDDMDGVVWLCDCDCFMWIYDYFMSWLCVYLCGLGVFDVVVEEMVQECLLCLWLWVVEYDVV